MIIAIDPGKEKCGLAVLDYSGYIVEQSILPRTETASRVAACASKYGVSTLVVGQGSFGRQVEKELAKLDLQTNIFFINEKDSTRQARKRYWQKNQPKGILRLIPTSLRVPPVPVDDHAAVILGERYLRN